MASAPDPSNPSHKTRAHQLRKAVKAGQALHESDQLWLADYDEKVQRRRPSAASIAADVGASQSKGERTVKFEMAEKHEAQAIGTGPTAAAIAAGAALATREEGRRLDSLTMHSIDALKEAVAVYKDICLMLRERTEVLEHTHIEMLQSVRTHFIAATEAESALVQRDAEQKPEDQLLQALLANYLGVDPGKVPPPRPRPQRPNGHNPRPPANGKPT